MESRNRLVATTVGAILSLFSVLLLHPAFGQTTSVPDLQIAGQIVFTARRDGNSEIYTMNRDGTDQICLTNNPAEDIGADWAPDGAKIVFASERDGNWEIYVMNADGTTPTRLTANLANDNTPSWSPDGTKIAFESNRDGNAEIYTMNSDGTDQTRLTINPEYEVSPLWSPDGTKIAFSSGGGSDREIYVMNADGTSPINVTNSPTIDIATAWSPDGMKIAFMSDRNGNDEVFVMNADGTGPMPLTNDPAHDDQSDWSPTGSEIAFDSSRNGYYDIYVMQADGTNQTRLTSDTAHDDSPSWTPFRRIGQVTVGGSISRTMVIQNKGIGALLVSSITFNDAQFTASPSSFLVPPEGSQTVTVVFNPTSAGTKYATLTISSNDPDSPATKMIVNGTATASPSRLSVSPVVLSFGNVDRTQSATLLLRLRNTGGSLLTVSSLADDSDQFSFSPAAPFSVAAGDSATVTVTFSPTSAGTKSGTLTIISNDPVSPSQSVILSGNGVDIPPGTPQGLDSSAGDGQVVLSWTAVSDADLSHYVLYRTQTIDASGDSVLRAARTATTITDMGMPLGTYYYRIAAVDSAGNHSALSAQVPATLSVLLKGGDPTPARLTFTTAGSQTVSVTDSGNTALSVTPSLTGTDAAQFSVIPNTVTPVGPGMTRTFAINFSPSLAAGHNRVATLSLTHNATNRVSPMTVALVGDVPPATPQNLSASVGQRQVTLTWTAGAETDLTHYVIYRGSTVQAPGDSVGRVTWPSQTYTDTALVGTVYYYHVAAVDSVSHHSEASNRVQVTLNRPPVAVAQSVSTAEDTPVAITLAGTDPDGDVLTYAVTRSPAQGILSPLSGSGLTYTPNAQVNGQDTLTFTVNDGQATSPPAAVAIAVTAVNDAPTMADLPPQTILEDAGPQAIPLTVGPGGGPDEAAQAVIVSATSNNPALIGNPSVSDTTLSYTPMPNANGAATITVRVRDNGGTVNGGVDSLLKSFSITVTAVNDTPELVLAIRTTAPEGGLVRYLLEAMDVDGDSLSYSAINLPNGATLVSQVFTWVPTYSQAGTYYPTFSCTDGKGGADSRVDTTLVTDATPPPLVPLPAVWDLGDVSQRLNANRTFWLRNPAAVTARVDSARTRTSVFTITSPAMPFSLAGGDSVAASVRFTPALWVNGYQRDTLTVSSSVGMVRVPLIGRGFWIGIAAQPREVDFGQVRLGTSATRVVTISNPGNELLQISQTEVSVPTVTIAPRQFSVTPGSSQTLTLSYLPQAAGLLDAFLTVAGTADSAVVVHLRGEVVIPRLSVVPGSLTFGRISVDSTARRSLVLRSTGTDTLRIQSFTGYADPFALTPMEVPPLAPLDSTIVRVSFIPVDRAIFADTLTVTSNAEPVRIPTSGEGIKAELTIPDMLALGQVRIGDQGEALLVVRNPGNDTLRVNEVQVANSRFAALPTQLKVPPGGLAPVTVTFGPSDVTPQTGLLIFSSNAGTVETVLTGTGVASNVTVRLQPAQFGQVWVGTERSLEMRVRNHGLTQTDIEEITLLPAGATDLSLKGLSLPTAVAAGESLVVATITFRPQTVTTLSGVAVRLHGPGLERTIALQGAGVLPPILRLSQGARSVSQSDTLFVGPAAVGQTARTLLELSNPGQDTLWVDSTGVSLSVFEVTPSQLAVPPDHSADLELTFQPTSQEPVAARLLLRSNDPQSPHRYTVMGTTPVGVPILSYAPIDTLQFGVVPQGESGFATLRLQNRGRGELTVQLISFDRRFAPEQTDTLYLAPGQQRETMVRFSPIAAGWQLGVLQIRTNDPEIPQAIVVMRGMGGGLLFEPPAIDFGEQVLETATDSTLWLINHTRQSAAVILQLYGNDFTVDPRQVIVAPDGRMPLSIGFRPRYEGSFSAKLESNILGLSVNLFGVSVAGPAIGVSPSLQRDFGEVEIGEVGRGAFTISNQGAGPLRLFDAVSSKLTFQIPQADQLPLTIEPGGELVLEVLFIPESEGPSDANLVLRCNDPSNRELVRLVTGRGIRGPERQPAIDIITEDESGELNFGSLDVGQSGIQILVVANTGTGALRVARIDAAEHQVSAAPESLIVVPGGQQSVQIQVTPDPTEGTQGLLRLVSNDPERPIVRLRYLYTRPAAEFVVLTDPLCFIPTNDDSQKAPLAIYNVGSARGIVELVDPTGQLSFDQDRLTIEPGVVGRTQVTCLGNGGGGQLVLVTNSPSQRQLSVPWQIQAVLTLVTSVPADGATGLSEETTLSLLFNHPLLRVSGQTAQEEEGAAAFEARIVPEPLNRWARQLRVLGSEVRIPLRLASDQTYRVVVLDVQGQQEERLVAPVEVTLTTGAQPPPDNRLTGRILFADGRALQGTVFLADTQRRLVASARLLEDGTFELRRVAAGQYALFAQEEGTGLSFAYEEELALETGESRTGLDLILPAQQEVEEVIGRVPIDEPVEIAPQSEVQEADSTFVVPIYTDPVADLTGFMVQISFDPTQVDLLAVDPDSPDERNALFTAGGFPLFLKRVAGEGIIEYGGSLLAAKPQNAPDEGGLLAYFTFRARTTRGTVQVDQIQRRTLHGEDSITGSKVSFRRGGPRCSGDFDGSGGVDFTDFFAFADAFGREPTGQYAVFDLDGDGAITFGDFFLFADFFGQSCQAAKGTSEPLPLSAATLEAHWIGSTDQAVLELTLGDQYPARGLGLLLEYDPTQLRFQHAGAGRDMVVVAEQRPGILLVGQRRSSPGAGPLRLSFQQLNPNAVVQVVEAAVRESDGSIRALLPLSIAALPQCFSVSQNYPNPFNPTTSITYQLPRQTPVRITVHDLLGQTIRVLFDQVQPPGPHRVTWDGRDTAGHELASGVYFYRVEAGVDHTIGRMVLLR